MPRLKIPVSLASLYSARAAIDTAILAAEQELGIGETEKEPGSCPNCGASPEQQEINDTMEGTKRRFCKNCRVDWTP